MKSGKKSTRASKKNLILNVYSDVKYQKTEIKSCKGKININFHNNKIPLCKVLSVFLYW